MIRKVSYESQERREAQVLAALNAEGIKSLEEANEICEAAGVDPYQMCEDTHSASASRTQSGHTLQAQPSLSSVALRQQPTLLRQSV